jgi:phosphatidylglycerophosphatase C
MAEVAAFDFDGTLTNGGSIFDFLTVVSGRQAVLRATAALAPRLTHAAVVGGRVADAAKEELFVRVLGGVEANYLDQVGAEFAVIHLAAHIRPTVRRRLDWHRGRGDKVVIVSASLDAYVRVAAERLAADGAIATQLEVDGEGQLTGRYAGGNCRGEEKIRRLRLWMVDAGLEGARLWAYGNSRGDLRMLRSADTGVDVGRLGRLGRLRDFNGLDETGPHRLDA